MQVALVDDALRVGEHFQLVFQRTLRIPDDGRTYPLPPGLGRFPVFRCAAFAERMPADWASEHAYFIPMYQREALWLGFGNDWPPFAVKVALGGINAVSGRTNAPGLHGDPQDYVVCPAQLWLDGINTGSATIRQFVAVPLGRHLSVEASITGRESVGGMQIEIYPPRPGVPLVQPESAPRVGPARQLAPRMGLGAGGQMRQKIYPDPHGITVWDDATCAHVTVHIVNSEHFRALTGLDPPPTPIDVQTYDARGLPWFDVYDEHMGDVPAPEVLHDVRTVAQGEREQGSAPEESGAIDPGSVPRPDRHDR